MTSLFEGKEIRDFMTTIRKSVIMVDGQPLFLFEIIAYSEMALEQF